MTPPTDLSSIPTPPSSITADQDSSIETPDTYEKLRAEQDGKHGIELSRHLFYVARVSIWAFYIFFLVLLTVWFVHLITPKNCPLHWLGDAELLAIERILYASTLVSLAGKYFSKFNLLDKK